MYVEIYVYMYFCAHMHTHIIYVVNNINGPIDMCIHVYTYAHPHAHTRKLTIPLIHACCSALQCVTITLCSTVLQ